MSCKVKMKELNKKWFNSGIDENLEIRCGINTGMATVGGYGFEYITRRFMVTEHGNKRAIDLRGDSVLAREFCQQRSKGYVLFVSSTVLLVEIAAAARRLETQEFYFI